MGAVPLPHSAFWCHNRRSDGIHAKTGLRSCPSFRTPVPLTTSPYPLYSHFGALLVAADWRAWNHRVEEEHGIGELIHAHGVITEQTLAFCEELFESADIDDGVL